MAFLPGDHVYISRGVPSLKTSIVKHHAIVVATLNADQVEIVEYGVYNQKDGSKKWVAGTGMDHGLFKDVGEVKRRTINLKEEPGWTMATNLSDAFPAPAVVERALFVLDHASLLPTYHLTNSNGECLARWCKTGRFESMQAKELYDRTVNAIQETVAPVLDTSGRAVSKAIAPTKPTSTACVTSIDDTTTTTTGTGATTTKVAHNNNNDNSSRMASTREKASSAIQQASDKIVAAVRAVGAMVGNREQELLDKWSHTSEALDLAFAQHQSTCMK